MLESTIENYLVKRVREIGGEIRKLKWVSHRGAPDRVVFYKGCHFVELKKPGEKLRLNQRKEHLKMAKCGVPVTVIDEKEQVDSFIEYLEDM